MTGVGEKISIGAAAALSRIGWYDWRVKSVFAVTIIVLILTAAIPIIWPTATNPSSLFGAIYASWVGGVALFVLVGLSVAVASLARPEQESFDARARNLLRRQSGTHIDYIVGRLNKVLEPYVEYTEKKLVVVEFHEGENKLQINHSTATTMRSFLDDVATQFPASVSYINAAAPPPGKAKASLTYLRVNGATIGEWEEFDNAFVRKFDGHVPKYGTCKVEHRLNYWIKAAEEPNRHTALRYTRALKLVVENNLPQKSLTVEILAGNALKNQYEINAGNSETIINLTEIAPGENVYDVGFDRVDVIDDASYVLAQRRRQCSAAQK